MTHLQTLSLTVLVSLSAAGCSLDGLLNSDKLPKDVSDPAITQTPQGAQAAYNATLDQFRNMFGQNHQGYNRGNPQTSFVAMTGILSDELSTVNVGEVDADRRAIPDNGASNSDGGGTVGTYGDLQELRGQASQALNLLVRYIPEQPALAGHMYALEAYAELFLAELFCSGIPLSTVDYEGDFTYKPGSSTEDVFAHAVALFDTALSMAGDSARVLHLAQVGRGRTLLAMGSFADAAAAVAGVPDEYRYNVAYSNVPINGTGAPPDNFAGRGGNNAWSLTVGNLEGFNGLDYVTSGDPRTKSTKVGTYTVNNAFTYNIYHPDKYDTNGASPLVLASGVEARLIEAEAALQQGDAGTWLTKLNTLRTDGTFDVTGASPPDTLWHAGTGGVAGLRLLADPGTATARVDLLFRERAFWLFLTGHRQGDLRRLIRQYGRDQSDIYPVGPYPGGAQPYGGDVTAPVPASELNNPLYTGCASRGA